MFCNEFETREQQLLDLIDRWGGCARCHKRGAVFVGFHIEERECFDTEVGGFENFNNLIVLCEDCAKKTRSEKGKRKFNFQLISGGMNLVLRGLGVEYEDPHARETAFRAAKALMEILAGMDEPEPSISVFDTEFDEIVIVRDIEFVSMCAHHMLPFYGIANVGYLPDKKIVGLSKIPRIVEHFAKRLQVQEELTKQVAGYLLSKIQPRGVGVVITAKHDCVACRGIKSKRAEMITSVMLGEFRESPSLKAEFMRLLSGG